MSDSDSIISLTTQERVDIKNEITKLDMIERRIECGCIVKIRIEDLFDPVTRKQSLSYPHIYGIVTNLADVSEHSGLRAWDVDWFFIHDSILPADHDYSYLTSQLETDMSVVNWPEDEVVSAGQDYRLKWYFKKEGSWKIKNEVENECEFCGGRGCDRMTFKGELSEALDEGHEGDYLDNGGRRFMMYGLYTHIKYGNLGAGVRKTVQVCVSKLICLNFPSFDVYIGLQIT